MAQIRVHVLKNGEQVMRYVLLVMLVEIYFLYVIKAKYHLTFPENNVLTLPCSPFHPKPQHQYLQFIVEGQIFTELL